MNRRPSRPTGPLAAFTLVELLVSSAILGIMMAVLLSSMASGLSLWRVTEGKIAADREGRSGHLLLAQDLANAFVPTNASLWPQIKSNGSNLGFLVTRPADYQNASGGDVGDICYVDYSVRSNGLYRRFVGSKETYQSLKNNRLPASSSAPFQLLADNVVPNTNVTKVLMAKSDENGVVGPLIMRTNFIGVTFSYRTNSGTVTLQYETTAPGKRPDAIEVNLATTDLDGVKNLDLMKSPNFKLRNSGFFTFRVNLPK
jgi:prepilin-type N-terminal cleavage/methylation domain-containing protein